MEQVLHVEGMHCEGCAKRVQDALLKIPGVLSAQVDLASESAHIAVSVPVESAILAEKIDLLGFTLKSVK